MVLFLAAAQQGGEEGVCFEVESQRWRSLRILLKLDKLTGKYGGAETGRCVFDLVNVRRTTGTGERKPFYLARFKIEGNFVRTCPSVVGLESRSDRRSLDIWHYKRMSIVFLSLN